MSDVSSTGRNLDPQRGGNLQIDLEQKNWGWPNILSYVAEGWWKKRITPYHANYGGLWEYYLNNGLVNEIDQGIIDKASQEWQSVQTPYPRGFLTKDTPWTLADTNGYPIVYTASSDPPTMEGDPVVAATYACGLVLHYYYQLDLGKMARRVLSRGDSALQN